MVMPRLAGPEAFEAMRTIVPEVKVLLASGFSINGAASGLLKAGPPASCKSPTKSKNSHKNCTTSSKPDQALLPIKALPE